MRQILMAAATAATLAVSSPAAQAFPIAPPASVAVSPDLTLVSGGCGPYRHRGPFGGCRPNFGGPRFGGPRFGGPRFYGRPGGFHRGFDGDRRPFGPRHYY